MGSVCAAGPPGASVEEQVVSKHDACDCKCELVLRGRISLPVKPRQTFSLQQQFADMKVRLLLSKHNPNVK